MLLVSLLDCTSIIDIIQAWDDGSIRVMDALGAFKLLTFPVRRQSASKSLGAMVGSRA